MNAGFDVHAERARFPALHQSVHGRPLVWLDNAATTQKPDVVIDEEAGFYRTDNANVHRGVHTLSARATERFDAARATIATFLGAASPGEIVFVRGTTEAINLVANSWGDANLHTGDEIAISAMEHHSDIVPWQMLCQRTGAVLTVIPHDDRGVLQMQEAARVIGPRTRLVACVHVSNALGTVNPVAELARLAHSRGALILVDGAQATAHVPVDVRALDVDFYAFSGHKVYGPMGIGALYGRASILAGMPPWQGGGDMIRDVRFQYTLYADPPARFEAGTPNVAGAIALARALQYLSGLDREAMWAHEAALLRQGTERLQGIPGLRMIGTSPDKVAILGFVIEGVHPHDLGTILDRHGVAIRTGHHCAQPVMQFFGVPATARASLGLYNVEDDIDRLIDGLHAALKVLR